MTDQLRTFEAPQLGDLKFTVWDREGEPWFIAKEVMRVLGYKTKSTFTVLGYLQHDEKTKARIKHLCNSEELLGEHKMSAHIDQWFISESGLYKLIMRSKRKEAQQFQDWVTKVVLPAIRQDGAYIEGEEKLASGEMSEDEFVLKAMQILQSKVERLTVENQKMTQELTLLTPKPSSNPTKETELVTPEV